MTTHNSETTSSLGRDEQQWWDHWNVSYRSKDDGGEVPDELFSRTAAVIDQIYPSGDAHILEIACGAGALSRRLKEQGALGINCLVVARKPG